MIKNIRRFAAVASLTLVLAGTPVMARPSRDDGGRDRTSIGSVVKRFLQRVFGLQPTGDAPIGPIPAPTPTPTP